MAVKNLICEKLGKRADREYVKMLESRTVSFDEWIRKKESGLERFDMTLDVVGKDVNLTNLPGLSYSANAGAMNIRIIPYSMVDSAFSVAKYLEDILVFVNGALTDKAIPLLTKAFSENPETAVCYGDEDIAEPDETGTLKYGKSVYGTRRDPFFKPDWSPNAFLNHFYFCNIVAIRRSAFRNVRWSSTGGAQGIYRTLLRFIFANEFNLRKSVLHIDEILVHAFDYEMNSMCLADADRYAMTHLAIPKDRTEISVVILSRDNPSKLEDCIRSLTTSFNEGVNLEVVVVDNGSNEVNRKRMEELRDALGFSYIYRPMDFNYAEMINIGVGFAKNEILFLLNDDIIFPQKGTLTKLANHVKYKFSGAVGAKVIGFGTSKILHAGIFNGRTGPIYKLRQSDDSTEHYHGFNRGVENVSAVSGTCLMVRKDVFEKANGMKPSLGFGLCDVEFCFKLLEAGYTNTVCNNTILNQLQGQDFEANENLYCEEEVKKLYAVHPAMKGYDPYGSKYLLSDCPDSRITAANEYEYETAIEEADRAKWCDLDRHKEDRNVVLHIEFAGPATDYTFRDDADGWLIQGFAIVDKEDNACYRTSLLFKKKNVTDEQQGNFVYELAVNGCARYDIGNKYPMSANTVFSGFCINLHNDVLPEGVYEIGVLKKGTFGKNGLFAFSGSEIVINQKDFRG